MNDDTMRTLLHDAAGAIEPGDRLTAIRSATSGSGRTTWGWWTAGGVGLTAAAVVTAMMAVGGSSPQGTRPGPATAPTSATTPSPSAMSDNETLASIYYVGDTPDGPRLYRELRRLPADLVLGAAVDAAVGRDLQGAPMAPLDPDYRVPWPAGTTADVQVRLPGELIEISLGGDPEGSLHDRGSLSEIEASLAIEQLIRTAQGATGEPLPVRLLLYGEATDQVLGVPAAEPLTTGSTLETLAHVSLSSPAEGQEVDNDRPLMIRGVGNSFEGNIVTRIQRWEGTAVVAEKPTIAGWGEDRLFPFTVTFDLSDVPPGDYDVISTTDDPSGRGRMHTDSRRITIVD